jgi:hypothetical protein
MWHVFGCLGMVVFLTLAFVEWNSCYLVRQVNSRNAWFLAAGILGYVLGIIFHGAYILLLTL